MKLVIGLGNPGEKYKNNRHNAGHLFIDFVNQEIKAIKGIKAIKSNTFMNNSGEFVRKQLSANRYPLTALYIVHDDLDIPLGQYKIQFGVGPKVHNGILSIEQELGTKDFWRVRVGIDDRPQIQDSLQHDSGQAGFRIQGEKYVLENFTVKEKEILGDLFLRILSELEDRLN